MRSESEAATTLDRINLYLGFANEIFMENSPRKTGYNIETQIVARLARM